MKAIWIANMIIGMANLAFYAWGDSTPASLALGIACLFCATMAKLDERSDR